LLNPKLEILPIAQRSLWKDLYPTPSDFVLYGGTALALRLGHRQSEDFDFFSNESFEPSSLLLALVYLKEARVDQRHNNTLTVIVDQYGPVKLSFFGDVRMSHVQGPDRATDNGLQIASLLDLTATKLKTIQQRAEAKDYLDIAAALGAGVDLSEALGAARAIYGRIFNSVAALKALTYFEDGNLPSLSSDVQGLLRTAAERVKLETVPNLVAKSGIVSEG
jgi:predicted nucleotidyltransferase component of viral defense system